MKLITYIIDSFTSTPFKGNPTGVCCMNEAAGAKEMQAIANELSFPVTAFIIKKIQQQYDIRYFTPTTEIPACGHATLAAAKAVMLEDGAETASFRTIANITLDTFSEDGKIMMTYPVYEMEQQSVRKETMDSLKLNSYLSAGYCTQLETLFIELGDANILRGVQPDYPRLTQSSDTIKEVVITSRSDNAQYDYLLRSFCPWIGIDEDPVTGSVHSVLAGFWLAKLNKNVLKAYQSSKRGGELLIRPFPNRVEIGGEAVVIMKGTICI